MDLQRGILSGIQRKKDVECRDLFHQIRFYSEKNVQLRKGEGLKEVKRCCLVDVAR
jgi:hypothetical protein